MTLDNVDQIDLLCMIEVLCREFILAITDEELLMICNKRLASKYDGEIMNNDEFA